MLPGFDLIVGRSVSHVLDLMLENETAMLVAGATDFIPLARAGRWHTSLAIDITRLDELRGIEPAGGGLEIGALTTQSELMNSSLVLRQAPVLAEAAAHVAGPQIQARATLGGSVCTASPAADTVPALLVLDAVAIVVGPSGERSLPLSDFVTGPGRTALRQAEILKSVYIPSVPEGAGMVFHKLGKRKALSISLVNAAALLVPDGDRVRAARLALGAVAPTVLRCPAAESYLADRQGDETLFAEAAERVLDTIRPIDDVRASAAYRRVAAVALAHRSMVQAWERANK